MRIFPHDWQGCIVTWVGVVGRPAPLNTAERPATTALGNRLAAARIPIRVSSFWGGILSCVALGRGQSPGSPAPRLRDRRLPCSASPARTWRSRGDEFSVATQSTAPTFYSATIL